MGQRVFSIPAVGICAVGLILACSGADGQAPPTKPTDTLLLASGFASIADRRARSVALFEEAGKVLQHPRCVNCHPAGDRPRQTDYRRLHIPRVARGADGHGAPGMRCNNCHHRDNFDQAGVPGNDHWHLAPLSMAWEDRSLGQICEQLKDPARNGNRDLETIANHVVTDSLVNWSWSPGPGRAPAPGTNAQFGELIRAWVESGAECPSP
jgi:hypothetical protein